MSHTFIRAIVCIEEPWLPFLRQRLLVYGKTMVLRGNEAALSAYLNARLVLPTVTKFQLKRICAGGEGQELMSQADSQHWEVSSQTLADDIQRLRAHFGITGSVRKDNPVSQLLGPVVIPWHS